MLKAHNTTKNVSGRSRKGGARSTEARHWIEQGTCAICEPRLVAFCSNCSSSMTSMTAEATAHPSALPPYVPPTHPLSRSISKAAALQLIHPDFLHWNGRSVSRRLRESLGRMCGWTDRWDVGEYIVLVLEGEALSTWQSIPTAIHK